MRCMSLLLAQSGHPTLHRTCPLLGVKRTCANPLLRSLLGEKRTSLFAAQMSAKTQSGHDVLPLATSKPVFNLYLNWAACISQVASHLFAHGAAGFLRKR